MASETTETLQRRVETLEGVVKKCNEQIDSLLQRFTQLENANKTQTRNRDGNFRRLLRKKRCSDIDSSSSDGSFEVSKTSPKGIPYYREVYQEVLQENHKDLLTTINLTNTTVLDQLVTYDVVSVSDAEWIQSNAKPKDKIRELLLKLPSYGKEKFHTFCKSLESEYPFLSAKLRESFRRKSCMGNESTEREVLCYFCKIKHHVDIFDVIDDLYTYKILNCNSTKDIAKEKKLEVAWNEIAYHINGHELGLEVFCKALEGKYEHLQFELVEAGIEKLKCECKNIKSRAALKNAQLDVRSNRDSAVSSHLSDTTVESFATSDTTSDACNYSKYSETDNAEQINLNGKRQKNTESAPLSSAVSQYIANIESTNKVSALTKRCSSLPCLYQRTTQSSYVSKMGFVQELHEEVNGAGTFLTEKDNISSSYLDKQMASFSNFDCDENRSRNEIPIRKRQCFSRTAFKRRIQEPRNTKL